MGISFVGKIFKNKGDIFLFVKSYFINCLVSCIVFIENFYLNLRFGDR